MKFGHQDCTAPSPGSDDRLPLDLQLDLLVDEELPEDLRAALLARLDMEPGRWRELSIRFLQRQVEKGSVRQLMAGGRLVDIDVAARMDAQLHHDSRSTLYRIPGLRWVTPGRLIGVAAGVLIATTSALITVQVMHGTGGARVASTGAPGLVVGASDMIQTSLPGSSVGLERPVSVQVPVAVGLRDPGKPWEFMDASSDKPVPRRSVIIQPDGRGNALVIPVNTLPVNVY